RILRDRSIRVLNGKSKSSSLATLGKTERVRAHRPSALAIHRARPAYIAATQSSAIIPQPPGNDSACRAGNGFQISNTRKSIKPNSKYFQFTWTSAKDELPGEKNQLSAVAIFENIGKRPARSRVRHWPETSSMTTT